MEKCSGELALREGAIGVNNIRTWVMRSHCALIMTAQNNAPSVVIFRLDWVSLSRGLLIPINYLNFGLLITIANVWIFGNYSRSPTPSASPTTVSPDMNLNYCDPVLYYYVFSLLIVVYVCAGLCTLAFLVALIFDMINSMNKEPLTDESLPQNTA